MEFNLSSPIYLQIMQEIKRKIASAEYKPGMRVPSVRELAVFYAVNPNTMQRALLELEREKLLFSERTSGRFVTEDQTEIARLRDEMADQAIEEFLFRMEGLGFDSEQISAKIKEGKRS